MTTGSRFTLDREALFEMLGYEPHEGQWQVHRSKAPRRVVACGTRWGKSTVAVFETIASLLEPRERALGWLVAPTYELTRRIFERLVAVLHDRMRHRIRKYDPRAHVIVVVNLGGGYSELRARSADRPAGLLGDALDFLVVDECTEIRDDVWDEYIAARLLDRHGTALLLSTPTDVSSWFFKQYRRAKKDPAYAAFAMPTTSNPHIDAALIEAERKRLAPEVFASQYEARFTGLDFEKCDTCGGPDVYARAGITLHDDERPKFCPDCGLIVNEDGKTAVAIETWGDEDRLACSVIIFAHEVGYEEFEFPDYCRRVLFISSTEITHPEQLPEGCM
jgi:hypothetical protein